MSDRSPGVVTVLDSAVSCFFKRASAWAIVAVHVSYVRTDCVNIGLKVRGGPETHPV